LEFTHNKQSVLMTHACHYNHLAAPWLAIFEGTTNHQLAKQCLITSTTMAAMKCSAANASASQPSVLPPPPSASPADPLIRNVVVYNTGLVQLTNVALQTSAAGNTATVTVACPDGSIAISSSMLCTVTITPLQASLDDGLVIELNAAATAEGGGNTVTASAAAVTISALQSPDFTYTLIPGNVELLPSAGDTVSLTLNIANAGNVKLNTVTPAVSVNGIPVSFAGTDCAITSSMTGLTAMGTGATAMVGPCQVIYTLTQADIELGIFTVLTQMSATYT
jgi:hypothetical protein